jgi:tRNA threonylcarbamoyladenosine biosynthesis protein TsaE
MEKILKTEQDTARAASLFAPLLKAPVTVAFTGELGAGKTTFIKYLCRELGYDGPVTSPTFSIMNQYEGSVTIYHYDMYRLTDADALYDIGYYDYADSGISLVEWSENVNNGLCGNIIHVDMSYCDGGRKIIIPEIDSL